MDNCPHCGKESISSWEKGWSTWLYPAVCKECGKESKMEPKFGIGIYTFPFLISLIILPCVIYFASGWPLVLFVPVFIFSIKKHVSKSVLRKV
tara:strand:- start:191 stop:469 length:279 start_codon:yes stop_codon:yes gene_type:complete